MTPTNQVTLEELNILAGIIKTIPKLHFASLYEIAFSVTTVFSCHKIWERGKDWSGEQWGGMEKPVL